MKRQWRVRRQFLPVPDGAQRWDQAYQHLLQWRLANVPRVVPPSPEGFFPKQEESDEHGNLCARLDRPADPGPDH
jgi:hypothetical protein